MEHEGLDPRELEALKMTYDQQLEALKEEYRGNPGQQEAFGSLSGLDPAVGIRVLEELKSVGLTPWDVQKVYGPMYMLTSEQTFSQQNLQRKILGHTFYPRAGDYEKVVKYLVEDKGKDGEKNRIGSN